MKTGKTGDVIVVSHKKDMNLRVKTLLQVLTKSVIIYAGVIVLNAIVMNGKITFDNTD